MEDKRSYFTENDRILLYHNGKPEQYTIHQFLGSGGVSACYTAANPDGVQLILKEFNPILPVSDRFLEAGMFSVLRNPKNELVFDGQVKAHPLYAMKRNRFRKSFETAMTLAANDTMNEHMASPFQQLSDSQGNLYQVITYHAGFSMSAFYFSETEKETPASLAHFLTTLKNVAEAVLSLHHQGKVHLDIKPGNIYIGKNYDTVKFIDTDSIVSLEQGRIPKEELPYLPYSEGYSPLELLWRYPTQVGMKSDVFSVGACLFAYLFGRTFDIQNENIKEYLQRVTPALERRGLNRLLKRRDNRERICMLLRNILCGTLQALPRERLYSLQDIKDDLQETLDIIQLEKLQKETQKANYTFAAYHLLKERPLFRYLPEPIEKEQTLKIGIVGSHPLREELLSAILCMQMLHVNLEIILLSEDGAEFWNRYLSESSHFGIKDAVTWEISGKASTAEAGSFDRNLVGRRLAHIRLITRQEEEVSYLNEAGCRYFIFLHTSFCRNVERVRKLETLFSGSGRICAAYLDDSGKIQTDHENIELHYIAVDAFGEDYNETLVKKDLYRMGLMAHYYYCGYMDLALSEAEARDVETAFRDNLYNVLSSGRAGLHSIYKLGSLGISPQTTGWIRRFIRKITEESTLEQLGWLEHLSWEAYLLTKGARPVPAENFEEIMDQYAYKEGNNWKIYREGVLYHPLLVSSDPSAHKTDALDQRSWGISMWYCRQREDCLKRLTYYIEALRIHAKEISLDAAHRNCQELMTAGESLIRGLTPLYERLSAEKGVSLRPAGTEKDKTPVSAWQTALGRAEKAFGQDPALCSILDELRDTLGIMCDAYKAWDYKKYDKDLCLAIPDILSQ